MGRAPTDLVPPSIPASRSGERDTGRKRDRFCSFPIAHSRARRGHPRGRALGEIAARCAAGVSGGPGGAAELRFFGTSLLDLGRNSMPFFTVEVDGTPTAVIGGQDDEEIRALLDEDPTRDEWIVLGALQDDSALEVRPATEDERMVWRRRAARAIAEGDLDAHGKAENDSYVVFLIPVSDPADEDEPEDD